MFTMSSVTTSAFALSMFGNGIIEYVHQAVIISSHEKSTIGWQFEIIDVGLITIGRATSITIFANLDTLRCPLFLGSGSNAVRILLFSFQAIEKELVCAISRADIRAIKTPVHTSDKAGVARKFAEKLITFCTDCIDKDVITVRANSKHGLIWWVCCYFAPFFSFFKWGDFLIEVIKVTNWHFSKIAANCYMAMLCAISDTSSLFVGQELWRGSSSRFVSCFRLLVVWNFSLTLALHSCKVEKHNTIVIAASKNAVLVNDAKSPHLAFKVRLHQHFTFVFTSFRKRVLKLHNSTIAESDKQVAIVKINRLRNSKSCCFHVNHFFKFKCTGIHANNSYLGVFTSTDELVSFKVDTRYRWAKNFDLLGYLRLFVPDKNDT